MTENNPGGSEEGVLAQAGALVSLLRDTADGYVELFTAELRQAGLSVSMMLGLGIVLAVFITGAWALLCASVAVAVWNAGFSLAACLLVLAMINVIGAFAVMLAIRALSRGLSFAATRRAISTQQGNGDAPAPAHM